MIGPLAVYVFVFALLEKTSKERFVLNQSNKLTRQFFGELIDSASASVTISCDGHINFYNTTFRELILEKLKF